MRHLAFIPFWSRHGLMLGGALVVGRDGGEFFLYATVGFIVGAIIVGRFKMC